tara:strand:+ start:3861 stop:8609 length:4749 start_codon:yes stop_codon:yes gene_type:complete
MSIDSDKDIIQLIIDAENLAAPELKETSTELLALGVDAQKTAKELDDLRIKSTVINSFKETGEEVKEMRAELVKSEVEFINLKKTLKEATNATDEQQAAVVKANIAIKAQRSELRSQETSYTAISKKAASYGVTVKSLEVEEQKLGVELESTKRELDLLSTQYDKNSKAVREQIIVENALQATNAKTEARAKSLQAVWDAETVILDKLIAKEKAVSDAKAKTEAGLKTYEAGLKSLNAQREKNEITAADAIRKEQELRTQTELSTSQVSSMRKALELESNERIKSANAAKAQVQAEQELATEKARVEQGIRDYTAGLTALNKQRERDEVSVSDAIIKEAELRKQYDLTEGQVSTMRKAINAATTERIKDAAAAKKQLEADEKLAYAEKALRDGLPKYEAGLRSLRAERDKGEISVSDAIRKEKELRNQYKLTESQVKSTKDAIKAESVARTTSAKSTDLLTTATRRLAQVYTVVIAAQKAAAAVTTSIKNYGELESAMVKVEKTTGAAAGEIELIADELIRLGEDITPTTTNNLLKMAEVAGQLGVKSTGDILKMVAAADALEVSTNLAGEEASTLLTRILKMTGEGVGEINGLASSVVALGNNFAVAEDEIVHMTREIVTGATSINLGSSAAAAYAATLKETGQTAERSRTAIFKMAQGIKTAIQNGGDDLERLQRYTGQTADELERNLGTRPEVVLTALINGLGDARERGENLTSILSKMGVTGSEATSVIEALAKNSERLNEALLLSNKSYAEQDAHFKEAAKAYSTQDAAIGRLVNRFTNLTAEIGKAYSDETDAAIRSATALIEGQSDKIIELMNLFGELGSAVTDSLDIFDNISNVFGSAGESISIIDTLTRQARIGFNLLTISINTLVLGIQGFVYAGAQAIDFFNDSAISDKWFSDYEAKMYKTKESIDRDLQDMKNAQADFNKESSSSFRDLNNALETYSGAISSLSEEEQKKIKAITESNVYVEGQNQLYRDLTERLVSVQRELDLLEKLQTRKNETDAVATKELGAKLAAQAKEAESIGGLTIATGEHTIKLAEYNERLAEQKALYDSGIITQELFANSVTQLALSVETQSTKIKENSADLVVARATVDSYAAGQVALQEQYLAGKISADELTESQNLLNTEYNVAQATLNQTATSTKFMSAEMATLDKQIDKTKNDITALEIQMAAAGKSTGEAATVTAKLRAEQALLADLTRERNELDKQDSLNYQQLIALQETYTRDLAKLNDQWKFGTITKAEYVAKSSELNAALAEMNSILGTNTATIDNNTTSVSKNKDAVVAKVAAVKQSTNAASLELDAHNKLTTAYDFSASSMEELSARHRELQGYINTNNKVSGVWYKTLANTYNLGFKREQQIIEEIKNTRKLTEQVESGSLSMAALDRITAQSNQNFRLLSDQQLRPLLTAIDNARAKMAALNGEIVSGMQEAQDRIDAALGNYEAIKQRENAREIAELQELLEQAQKTGNQTLVNEARKAIELLKKAQQLEARADGTSYASGNYTSSGGTTERQSNSTKPFGTNNNQNRTFGTSNTVKYQVELKSPSGNVSTINTSDEASAKSLLNAVSELGKISSQQ